MFLETREDLLLIPRRGWWWRGSSHDRRRSRGIREGDLIQALNFREVANRQGLYRKLWKHAAGATSRVAIVRKGQSLTIAVTSADRAEFFR